MNICFLCGDASKAGGTERMTAWLANQLCGEHQVVILSLHMAGDVFFPLKDGVCHQTLPTYPGKTGILKQILWIRRYILENHIDRVINVDMGMGFYGILAAAGTSAKTITWEHGNYFNNWGSRLFPYMRRFAAKHSDAVAVLTERDRENYLTHIPGCAPIHVLPNPAQMRDAKYDPDSKIILSVGHLLENKGYHRAVDVASKILPRHRGWQWIICGEGPERARLEQMIRDAGLEEQMKLPGLIRDMEPVYGQAAILVLTSEMEGLPMVLLEGKSHGLPLVAFDIMTGPSDIIADGVNGYLVDPFDLEQMAQKLELLMEDESLRVQMSRDASAGMEKFSEEMILSKWKYLLKET